MNELKLTLGLLYVHMMDHYKDFMLRTGQSLGLIANDQVGLRYYFHFSS